jgi:2-dehydro-3-deoxy-D-arabinonate dehydratase
VAWQATTSTAALYRPLDDLVTWLFAEQAFPDGVILSTGTGLVPEMDFTLLVRDTVRITIDQVGTLTNVVRAGKESMAWLTPTTATTAAREQER